MIAICKNHSKKTLLNLLLNLFPDRLHDFDLPEAHPEYLEEEIKGSDGNFTNLMVN